MLYIAEGIVLKKQEIKNSQWILTLFTKEYGKIRGFMKIQKNGSFDIGQCVETHIRRNGENNTITSIRTKIIVGGQKSTFAYLFNFLQILSCIDKHIPENGIDSILYSDIKYLIENQSIHGLNNKILRLTELRLLVIFQQEIQYQNLINHSETSSGEDIGTNEYKNFERIAKKLEAISRNHTLEELMRIQGIPSNSLDIFHTEFLHNFFPG